MLKKILALPCLIVVIAPAFARAESPVNLALFSPVQITKETESVTAFRFSLIYGRNADLQGLDLSLVGRNTGSFTGISWTGAGMVDGDFTGAQLGWLASMTKGNMQGLQIGLINIINNKDKLKVFPIVNWKS